MVLKCDQHGKAPRQMIDTTIVRVDERGILLRASLVAQW